MNIFVTDEKPEISAINLCDKHIPKMVVESAQMLSTAWHVSGNDYDFPLYKETHSNHPCNKWIRESIDNYHWLGLHALAMCVEYTYRFGKVHASQSIINIIWDKAPPSLPEAGLTPFAQAYYTKDETAHLMCHVPGDPIQSYRNYYKLDKKRFAKWERGREAPYWW